MSIRYTLQFMAHELGAIRRDFKGAGWLNRRKRRDRLIEETAYGVQNCLRALAMQFPPEKGFDAAPGLKAAVAAHKANSASGMETRSATDPKGRGPKGDSPTSEAGDAQTASPNLHHPKDIT